MTTEPLYEFVGYTEDGLARYEWRRPAEPEVMYQIPAESLRAVAAECEASIKAALDATAEQ